MPAQSERRLVTCLFIDVVGSTDATVRHGPERMQRLLGDAFAEMSATIAEHGGTVEKYVGDAIFALFGAPVTHADDAERALRAAEACARWSSAVPAAGTPATSAVRLAVRVGIETGEALVDLDAVDTRQRMAVGECVNVAARLQQHADPGEIVVGPTTHEATDRIARFEPMGRLGLKGLGEVDAWRFLDFASGDGQPEFAFVGRDAELTTLRKTFDRARNDAATLALIVGPPGQGKSRLAEEAIRTLAARTLTARCRPGAEAGLNTPLRQLLDADVGHVGQATAEVVAERISAMLGAEDGATVAAAVSHGAGLAVDERLLALPRMEQRNTIAEAWRRYLGALASEAPLVVWIEDIHWADPVVLRVIDVATWDVEAQLLILATARPEFMGTAHLRPRDDRPHIELRPLDPEAAGRLARAAGNALTDPTRAAGNPLFIIELARARSADGEMPVTIQAAIAARLDELEPTERELLQRASVVGETFDVRDAALLGELEPAEVAGSLGRVAHLGFVAPVDSRYRFHHALVREVAYGRLPVAERMALHARYAAEGVDPADVEALAHHWWEALKPPDAEWVWEDPVSRATMRRLAFAAHLAAGHRLEGRNAYEESADVYARAIELADDASDAGTAEAGAGRAYARQGRGDEAWEHRLKAISAFDSAGTTPPADLYADMLEIATQNWGYFQHTPDDREVLRLLDEGERAARSSGDDVSLARLLVDRASFTEDMAGVEEVLGLVDSPDAVRYADAASRLGQLYFWNGRVTHARGLFETIFERLLPAGAVFNEPEAMIWNALSTFHAGDLMGGDAIADGLLVESLSRSVHTRQHAYAVKAFLALARGAWDEVASIAQDLRQLVEANPDASFCLLGAGGYAYGAIAATLQGTPPEGFDQAIERVVPDSALIQAANVMVPKAMTGDRAALAAGLAAYARGLRLEDRERVWDVSDLMPAIALTMLERWDDLGPSLARLDEFAAGGSRLAGATAVAVREEEAAAKGGPVPTHEELRALGYAGIGELLSFRPVRAG
jgi:class 3 adenylate cyclase/tetratricopeptide (TPR) repeat protein